MRLGNSCKPHLISQIVIPLILIAAALLMLSCDPAKKIANPINHKPDVPTSPVPADSSTSQPTDIVLSWQCSDPDGDSLKYDVYIGTQADPSLVGFGLIQNSYDPGRLASDCNYRWRIAAFDSHNDTTLGPIWSFTTRLPVGLHFVGACTLEFDPWRWGTVIGIDGDFVYLSHSSRTLYIYEASNPANPYLAAQFIASGNVTDIEFHGQYAFLCEYGEPGNEVGLEILNITDTRNPTPINAFAGASWAADIEINYPYAYVSGINGLYTINIADPLHIVTVDSSRATGMLAINGNYAYGMRVCDFEVSCLDMYEILDNTSFQYMNSISLYMTAYPLVYARNHLFIGNNYAEIYIYSMESPTNPSLIGQFPRDFSQYYTDFSTDGNLLYVAGWIDSLYGAYIYDISDIANPSRIASYNLPEPAIKVCQENDLVYVIDDSPRLVILEYVP